MRAALGLTAFAAAAAAVPADAQFHGGTQLERAASDYGHCFYQQARSARQSGASADSAIDGAIKRCKGQRKRLVKITQSRLAATNVGGASAKSMAESAAASGDRSMVESLRREFAGKGELPGTTPK